MTQFACTNCGRPYPEEGVLSLSNVMKGEIVVCPDCGVDLEVVSVDPIELELAPQEAEDWGE